MGADVLGTQGARASADMLFTMLNRINKAFSRMKPMHYAIQILRI